MREGQRSDPPHRNQDCDEAEPLSDQVGPPHARRSARVYLLLDYGRHLWFTWAPQ
jgi:hypothetical protein